MLANLPHHCSYAPAEDLKYPFGISHYARGFAYVRKGDVARSEAELAQLRVLADDPDGANVKIWGEEQRFGPAEHRCGSNVEVIAGEIAVAPKDIDAAYAHFKRGVDPQDNLLFDEPQSWDYPVRQSLGALLLDFNRIEEAEALFRKDLLKNADNP